MKLIIYSCQESLRLFRVMMIFAAILCSNSLFADGSKDLYPSGATGVRAYLRSSNTPTVNWPFPNQGFHYVYAKAGERITMASSAQNTGGNAKIRLYSPSGTVLVDNTSAGVITNRTAELAGPQLSGQTGGNRYTPIYYLVPNGGDGIYRVEFVARATNDPQNTFNANDNWTQSTGDAGIMAWDVSVINPGNTAFIPGRVYTNVLNLTNGTGQVNSSGFYGKLYTLTKDGYTYRVSNNGNNGIYFTFFVNNNGFLDANTQLPIYQSLPSSSASNLVGRVQNPNNADTNQNITHKMFYTLPSSDLPASSAGAVPGNTTWLKNAVVTPQVSNVTVTGVEGTAGQVSNKGGYIRFNADVQGNYTISITGTPANPSFVTRVLTGASSAGLNQIYWDSKDGANNASPVGTFPVTITIRLQGAEVHFPYMDMEYNRFGTIVELLNYANLNQVVSDIVYWNDSNIPDSSNGSNPNPKNNSHLPPANSTGLSSNTNGHIWGVGGSGFTDQFGDNRAIDTWTFIKGQETSVTASVVVKSADLMVSSITPDQTNLHQGDAVAYTVKVKNGGPSDVTGAPFTFKIPSGLSPQNIQFIANGCGSESVALSYNAGSNTYSSSLNLPNGCEITYVITVTVSNTATAGNQFVEAAILRTNDVTDPDATDPNINTLPTSAQSECANNGLGGSCNNIKSNNAVLVTLACYNNPNTTDAGVPVVHGITLLKRAGTDNGNWPMIRNSAYTVLESNTKGLVITRMTSDPAQSAAANYITKITNPVEGMMVYDTFSKCLKIYSDGAWKCFNKPACP